MSSVLGGLGVWAAGGGGGWEQITNLIIFSVYRSVPKTNGGGGEQRWEGTPA